MVKYGIDVSYHQGKIDFTQVRKNAEFVIMRAGIGNAKDTKFEDYYAECKRLKIPVGCYWYSYAVTVCQAIQEANCLLNAVKGKQFEYPLYFDIETQKAFNTGKSNCSAMARAFCETLENAGYFAGIYASKSHLETYLSREVRDRFAVWVAHYGVGQTSYSGQFGMWQKSDKGKISGINGNVDLDECYFDYPAVIQGKGKNGFPKPENTPPENIPPSPKKSVEVSVVVDEVRFSGTIDEV